jgi:hypothetical protein
MCSEVIACHAAECSSLNMPKRQQNVSGNTKINISHLRERKILEVECINLRGVTGEF